VHLAGLRIELDRQQRFRRAAEFVDAVDVPGFKRAAFAGLGGVEEAAFVDFPGDVLGGCGFPFKLKAVADKEVARGDGVGNDGPDFVQRKGHYVA